MVSVAGYRNRDARSIRAKRRVRHDIRFECRDVSDARILAAESWMGAQLVRRLRFECEIEPFAIVFIAFVRDAHRSHPRNVSVGNTARVNQELATGSARCRGIQNSAGFARLSVGGKDEAQSLDAHLESIESFWGFRLLGREHGCPYGK